ncbi:hypothetical protein CU098_005059, partial [Rhizopus stolonifer]
EEPHTRLPASRKPSPLYSQLKDNIPFVMSPDQLSHQDIPSYVQSTTPQLRISKSSDTATTADTSVAPSVTSTKHPEGDFVPYHPPRRPSVRHARSISDSALLNSVLTKALLDQNKTEPIRCDNYLRPRSCSVSSKDMPVQPVSTIRIQTYMAYERLCQQQRLLQQAYQEIKSMADVYEKTATCLKQMYDHRASQFESIQKQASSVMEDQNQTESRLKDVEDNSAKLHYELKVMNDKLKDIEDNVGTFYGKMGLLERKMDDSQQSITTMLII